MAFLSLSSKHAAKHKVSIFAQQLKVATYNLVICSSSVQGGSQLITRSLQKYERLLHCDRIGAEKMEDNAGLACNKRKQ